MKRLILHPFFLALFPALSLFERNADWLGIQEILRPLIVGPVVMACVWLVSARLIRDRTRAAIVTSFFLILFFSFGHLLNAVYLEFNSLGLPSQFASFVESAPWLRVWAIAWLILFAGAVFLVLKTSIDLKVVSQFMNVFALVLLVFAGMGLPRNLIQQNQATAFVDNMNRDAPAVAQGTGVAPRGAGVAPRDAGVASRIDGATHPNIFYIIVDAYAREDTLKRLYGLDNSPFYSYLTSKGFYIARQGTANYCQTPLSLASSLNSIYLDELAKALGSQSTDVLPLAAMIHQSRLAEFLHDRGYRQVAFSTGFYPTDIRTADSYLSPSFNLTAFENEFLNLTPVPILLGLPFLKNQFDFHREQILYTLDHLPDAAEASGPVFVFAHILAPHRPFVFGANGEPVNPDRRFELYDPPMEDKKEYIQGYRDQVQFTSAKLQSTINEILRRSRQPPIIILQSDHGPSLQLDPLNANDSDLAERMSILDAFYFPDQDYSALSQDLSPVNTFRIVENQYFGGQLPILPNESYFSPSGRPYQFTNVSQSLQHALLP